LRSQIFDSAKSKAKCQKVELDRDMWNFLRSSDDIDLISAVDSHIEKHIGKVETVLHEIVSPTIHVDVHLVLANEHRPYHTLVTSGMAELPMAAPRGFEDCRFAELMICLPKEWPLDPVSFKDENFWWPIRLMKETARFPHDAKTWLYLGHTLINANEKPYASGTKMCSIVLGEPRTLTQDGQMIRMGKKRSARLLAIIPLYEEELKWKLENGFETLDNALRASGISEVLDPKRTNLAVLSLGSNSAPPASDRLQ
jgi:hypothetical protein